MGIGASKDVSIDAFLRAMSDVTTEWFVNANWDGDQCAVGLTSTAVAGHEAYVSSWAKPEGHYFVELELAGSPPAAYTTLASVEDLSLAKSVEMVANHLSK